MDKTEIIISFIAIGFLILGSAFFSGSETALTAITRARIYKLLTEGNKRAQAVSKLKRHKEVLIGTVLLGNTAINIVSSAIATRMAYDYAGDTGILYATIIMTILVLVVGEVLPKTVAIQHAERFSLIVAPIVLFLVKVLSPITVTVEIFVRTVMKWLGIDVTKTHSLAAAPDVIRGTIEIEHRAGGVEKEDRDMLGSILDLADIEAGQVMVHRTNVETIDIQQPAEQIIRQAVHSAHSRIPLYNDTPENIVGVLHVKSLVREFNARGGKVDIETIQRITVKPWFVPESTRLRDQLVAFRERRQHFAFVVNEYGTWLGIITLEDIIEEIVGEIDDEHDMGAQADIIHVGENTYRVEGTVSVRDLNRELDWSLPDEEVSTVAGLIINEARVIPEVGASFEFFGYRFTVEAKRENQITRVRIKRLPQPATPEV